VAGKLMVAAPSGAACVSRTRDEVIEVCRTDPDCNLIIYESNSKYAFATGACSSPCFKADYWKRSAHFVDSWENPFAANATNPAAAVAAAMTFRFEVSTPDDAFAVAARKALTAGGSAQATVAGSAAKAVLQSLVNNADFQAAWPSRNSEGGWGGVAEKDLSANVAGGVDGETTGVVGPPISGAARGSIASALFVCITTFAALAAALAI
jgi:hypothetical protein